MVAGRGSRVHGVEQKEDSAMKCLKCLSKLVAEKATGGKDFPRWLVGDDVALVEALRRENATGANEG
jgi:hypothetical protein